MAAFPKFELLPPELRQMIFFATMDRRSNLHEILDVCFSVVPAFVGRDFAHWPLNFVHHYFEAEAKIITPGFTHEMLGNILWTNPAHRVWADLGAQGYLMTNNVGNMPNTQYSREVLHLWYVARMTQSAEATLDTLANLTGLVFTKADLLSLLRLFVFLGPNPEQLGNYQERFVYLASLTANQRDRISDLLDRITEGIAHRHRHGLLQIDVPTIGRLFPLLSLVTQPGGLFHSPPHPWSSFARCGAYQACLLNWLLSLSFEGWIDLFARFDYHNTNWSIGPNLALWHRETISRGVLAFSDDRQNNWVNSQVTVLMPKFPTTQVSWQGANYTIPAVNMANMDGFVNRNALWAWDTARALPPGRFLLITGQPRPANPNEGYFVFDRTDDAHPWWS